MQVKKIMYEFGSNNQKRISAKVLFILSLINPGLKAGIFD
jgi:hypothetical protein